MGRELLGWSGQLDLLPGDLAGNLRKIFGEIVTTADEKFVGDEDKQQWVRTYLDQLTQSFIEWHNEDKHDHFIMSVQPYTSPAWNHVADSLIDPNGQKIEDISASSQPRISSRCYMPTVLSPHLFVRMTHFTHTAETDYQKTIVGKDFLPGGAHYS